MRYAGGQAAVPAEELRQDGKAAEMGWRKTMQGPPGRVCNRQLQQDETRTMSFGFRSSRRYAPQDDRARMRGEA